MGSAIQACVHCGFCLATCPTYLVLGEELDSPRGRIYLMKGMLEGELAEQGEAAEAVSRCLGCLSCVSACPSGVRYDHLITGFRHRMWGRRPPGRPGRRLFTLALMEVLSYPNRFRAAARAGRLARRLGAFVPARLRRAAELLPPALPPPKRLSGVYRPSGRPRGRVALLAGCVQQVLAPAINLSAVELLNRCGVEVVVPAGQGCCGALAMHAGLLEMARRLARRNLQVFDPASVDAIVTTAAGCGSAMKEYPLLFAGQPDEARARAFAERVRDVSEYLAALGDLPPARLPHPTRVAYQDACHLAHAQGIRQPPRRLLSQVENLELVELAEPDICCGSAGTYNIEHPDISRELGRRKVHTIAASGAELVVTGNIGCMVQIASGLGREGSKVRVVHLVELLAQASRTAEDGGRERLAAAVLSGAGASGQPPASP